MGYFDASGTWHDETAKLPSRLNSADVIWFGDSNIYNSAGHTLADLGSWYERFEAEFGLNGWVNNGVNGLNTYQVSVKFAEWATDEVAQRYNKESTFLLFWCGTNDKAERWFDGETATLDYAQHIQNISQIIEEKFPKAFYAFFIPPATDWSVWTGKTEPDDRNMTEKVPYIIDALEACNFPYCDMYHQSGITTAMLSDGIHLGGGGTDYTTDAVYRAYRTIRDYLINK